MSNRSLGIVHDTSRNIAELVKRLRAEDRHRYLYRGQNGVFGPNGDFTRQIPAVFRRIETDAAARAALELSRLRIAWIFDRVREGQKRPLDKLGPVWEMHFAALHLGDMNRPQSPSAMLGIAQHYGIPTECLDLTNLDPAAVFATQKWLRINEALKLEPGTNVPPDNRSDRGFIYRYDIEKLIRLGLSVGDLSSGNAGSRPIIQEARTLSLEYNQDLELFAAGAYEVFPFKLSQIPYVYKRPIKPSPLLNEDQRMSLQSVTEAIKANAPTAIRDLVMPRFFFSAHPFNPAAWQAYIGERPDPLLCLGRMIENELHEYTTANSPTAYAKALFADAYDRCINSHHSIKEFVEWERQRHASFRDAPNTPEMIKILPGEFVMGNDKVPSQMYIDETPARKKSMKYGFAVGKYPVTFGELRSFFEESDPTSAMLDLIEEVGTDAERIPAVAISWHEARAYCKWLRKQTGHKYRLLTEVEWEYVCRAGTQTQYWWGEVFDPWRANSSNHEIDLHTMRFPRSYSEARNELHYLSPIDRFEPNPWGLYDMHGNVWEWVEDVYDDKRTDPYLSAPTTGRERFRSLRGGSWMDPPLSLRSATRSWADPMARDRNIGFRVARDLPWLARVKSSD